MWTNYRNARRSPVTKYLRENTIRSHRRENHAEYELIRYTKRCYRSSANRVRGEMPHFSSRRFVILSWFSASTIRSQEERVISPLRCAAALVAVFWFSLPVQIQSSIPGFSGPRDTRSAARFQTPVVAGGSAANTLTPTERTAGWTLLFDGRSLAGWQPSGQAVWSVEDEMII